MSTLTLRGVGVRYARKGPAALTDFDGVVGAGEWVGLIGPNGAGKSSLLKAVVGLVGHSGSIDIDGTEVGAMGHRDRAARVAYVAQSPVIPVDMTVREYAVLGRTPYIGYFGSPTRKDRQVAVEVLERLGLADCAGRMLGELSGGERQRVVLARALTQQAPILLLDEPTSALDIGHQQQALEFITELRQREQLTVISALHDLTLAGTYTDRLTMLHRGDHVISGPPESVLTVERLGEIYQVSVSVDHQDGQVVVTPRRAPSVDRPEQ